jgi:quercetin dioxygenase-like cupin family protein
MLMRTRPDLDPIGRVDIMRVIHDEETISEVADPNRFTGRVWRTDFIETDDPKGLFGLRFVYEPGARSHWHVHECEQAIVAVHGRGLIAWEGLAAPILLRPGDWWHVTPDVPHWHGATGSATFAHLAVSAGGSVTWLHEVSDADYRVALRR